MKGMANLAMLNCKGCVSTYVLRYAKIVYDIRLYYKNHVMYIATEDDVYKVVKQGKDKSLYYFISTSRPYVLKESSFERGLFVIASKFFYKESGLEPTTEDWRAFLNDAFKSAAYVE